MEKKDLKVVTFGWNRVKQSNKRSAKPKDKEVIVIITLRKRKTIEKL